MFEIRHQVRRGVLSNRLQPEAQIYVVTESDDVRMFMNRAAVEAIEEIQRLPRQPSAARSLSQMTSPLIDR